MNNLPAFNLGLVGWPVDQSLSPLIHRTALNAVGLRGGYTLHPIPPLPEGNEGLRNLLDRMRGGKIQGLNVTVPHKQSVVPFLDGLTPQAEEIGAVNTIAFQGDRLIGDNTDARGFINDLKRYLTGKMDGKTVLILGAGGAARAVAFALSRNGWTVEVAARRWEQAEALVTDLTKAGQHRLSAVSLTKKALAGRLFHLLVNATPVGMIPCEHASPWPMGLPLPGSCFIYDLVYTPRDTVLVQQAREAGLLARSGLGMLVEQAALSFEIWTGVPAPRIPMYKAVNKHLEFAPHAQEVDHAA
jgi:shikimate dehydrogenase